MGEPTSHVELDLLLLAIPLSGGAVLHLLPIVSYYVIESWLLLPVLAQHLLQF
jgi:hypothetical protein